MLVRQLSGEGLSWLLYVLIEESSLFPAGLPLAPVEVKVVEDTAHQLRLIWGPPFTFPGENISYSVFIEDLVTGQKETVVGLTDTVYTHSVS